MASDPTTPVRVSKAAATQYTTTSQDPDLRSQINTVLLRDHHIEKIQSSLLHALQSDQANWPDVIQAHALALLRSGECTTFPQLFARVLAGIRADALAQADLDSGKTGGGKGGKANVPKGHGEGGRSLALPRTVVEEGLKQTREALEAICEVGE